MNRRNFAKPHWGFTASVWLIILFLAVAIVAPSSDKPPVKKVNVTIAEGVRTVTVSWTEKDGTQWEVTTFDSIQPEYH